MTITLNKIVPWGRSFEEYVRMFDLKASDLQSGILDCAGGPASFNAEMYSSGRRAVSCDPIYKFSASEIAERIAETYPTMLDLARNSAGDFLWREIQSPEHLGEVRQQAMKLFLEDFPMGVSQGRYRVGELPTTPFEDGEFGLALCSHFLFTYSGLSTLEFHLDSIRELCRVADEARVFPLLGQFGSGRSPYVPEVLKELTAQGYKCEVRRVQYEFQRGGNEMLCVSR